MEPLRTATEFRRMQDALEGGKGPVAAFGLPETAKAQVAAALCGAASCLLVSATETGAARLFEDAAACCDCAALFLPRETPLTRVSAVSGERREAREAVLSRLVLGERTLVVASMAALMQRLAPPEVFLDQTELVAPGDTLDPRAFVEQLAQAGYERVELVEGRGQVAVRGGLVDVFPPQAAHPYRIEFFGDEVDQIRVFDPLTQRTLEQAQRAVLPPAMETPQTAEAIARAYKKIRERPEFAAQAEAYAEGRPSAGADALLPLLYRRQATLLDYLPADAILLPDEPQRLDEAARTAAMLFSEQLTALLERGEGLPEQGGLMLHAQAALSALSGPRTLSLCTLSSHHPAFAPRTGFSFNARSAPQYLGDTAELCRDVELRKKSGDAVVILAGERAKSLHELLTDQGLSVALTEKLTRPPVPGEAIVTGENAPHGVFYPELHILTLTEHELYGKDLPRRTQKKRKAGLFLADLAVGDYVVHETHGVGRFVGVEALSVAGATRDYLLLEYRGGDRLYIPTDQLDRVQKYVGGEEDLIPPLSKLGGAEWSNRVAKAKESAKKLAFDLAQLYATRADARGFAFSPDTPWQKRLEERFPYRETPDQLSCLAEIKKDMENGRPMDRLLCGDVGYGKTEVALRAAFKAVQDSKQVAFLVPTTLLARQHFHTLSERFAEFPVRTACLSRMQDAAQRKEIKKRLASGEIDVIVGTHALLAKDVKFRDLGLLIVDEEQRFGVNHKEQIKNMRSSVDVLTLTATPIPRTLNMSMTGIRDISVIETPPEQRFPVQTFVLEYSDGLIVDAVTRELARGGQAYIVHNRVQTMEPLLARLSALLPEAHIAMAHGQMGEHLLEKTMLDFYEHKTDVLLCSTIIESGLDIPNVNTLIVLDADRFGLAQLYQLRGRVGRSTRLGYAYFTVRAGCAMNENAHKRLMAIREFTQFGAGFQLAMRDLEIRGAGSLLGAEQHGLIADIGYEFYCKLMRKAVREARGEAEAPLIEPVVEAPVDAHIPRDYIRSEVQRMSAYRRIANVANAADAEDVLDEIFDRYGEPPESVRNLVLIAKIKAAAARAGLESVIVDQSGAHLRFFEEAQTDGARLIAAVMSVQNAKLLATVPPAVEIRQKDGGALAMLEMLPQFIYKIDSGEGLRDRL